MKLEYMWWEVTPKSGSRITLCADEGMLAFRLVSGWGRERGDGRWSVENSDPRWLEEVIGGRGEIEELLERSERGVLELPALKTQAVFFWSGHNSGLSSAIVFKIFCWSTVKLLYYHYFLEAGIIKIMVINCLTDFSCHMTSRRAGFGDRAPTLASD